MPILNITDKSFDQNKKLFQFNHIYFCGDRYSFITDINHYENENLLFLKN